jgi:hypothetical protein
LPLIGALQVGGPGDERESRQSAAAPWFTSCRIEGKQGSKQQSRRSDGLGARAYDQNGRKLVEELSLGRRGLLKRLRGPGPDARGIPIEAVLEQSPERSIVCP